MDLAIKHTTPDAAKECRALALEGAAEGGHSKIVDKMLSLGATNLERIKLHEAMLRSDAALTQIFPESERPESSDE